MPAFFSVRAEDFEADTILAGYEAVRKRIKEIEVGRKFSGQPKDKNYCLF